ncbi:hypothetical protein SISNIDRAFT_457727 [Sistotremastrum niveocremeum HHB9708]|uniref:P-loop containing nucleoside triphosphate hydrolase protein n=2 Tax=Sistotremastraceae TaxID=3402574 RepID=A0A164R3N2_9AGAM|nr:hypothetical protein SISNIDRAFT_457727 [Sistotremastrum niveocremeum HHB9708]KZT35446.1 hypothetical protein SISSUDRAFT_1051406 [Sistotremastrum suecicum HHB10207 ss-3]
MLKSLWDGITSYFRTPAEVVIFGPLASGKKAIKDCIAPHARYVPQNEGYNQSIYVTSDIKFVLWSQYCLLNSRFKPVWEEYLPKTPAAAILVLDVTDVEMWGTIKVGLRNLLQSDNLRQCPVLVLLNKEDIADENPNDPQLTVERVQTDLDLVALRRRAGVRSAIWRVSARSPESLKPALDWVNECIYAPVPARQ